MAESVIHQTFANEAWKTGLRFKNLGSSFTSAQATALANNDFSEFWNGDYWVINGHNWRIVDNSGWARRRGDTNFDSPSLIVMPDDNLVLAEAYLIDGVQAEVIPIHTDMLIADIERMRKAEKVEHSAKHCFRMHSVVVMWQATEN